MPSIRLIRISFSYMLFGAHSITNIKREEKMSAKAESWLLEFCIQPRTMDEIMYGALTRILTDRGVKLPRGYAAWWSYLRDIAIGFIGKGYLQRNDKEQLVSVVTITQYG